MIQKLIVGSIEKRFVSGQITPTEIGYKIGEGALTKELCVLIYSAGSNLTTRLAA